MIDKLRFQVTPRNVQGFQVEIRPDPERSLELKIKTGEYPAGILGGVVQATDQAFREVLGGRPLRLAGKSDSSVILERASDLVLVEYSVPGPPSSCTLELLADDYQDLIEHAISSRTGPRTVFV